MFSFLLTFLITMQILSPIGGLKPKPKENTSVTFQSKIVETSVKAGSDATLQLSLTPQKGIHINLNPPMSFTLDKSVQHITAGKIHAAKEKKTGYLDNSQPVSIKLSLGKEVKPGNFKVTGSVTYYYCSDAEGWCNKYKQPVEMTINVVK